MNAQDFVDWMEKVGAKHASDIVRLLGISRNNAQTLLVRVKAGEPVALKLTVRLAMRAVADGQPPWGATEKGEDND